MEDPDSIFKEDGAVAAFLEARLKGKLRFIGFTGHKDPLIHLRMLQVAKENDFHFDTARAGAAGPSAREDRTAGNEDVRRSFHFGISAAALASDATLRTRPSHRQFLHGDRHPGVFLRVHLLSLH
jgi:hypothetical protein